MRSFYLAYSNSLTAVRQFDEEPPEPFLNLDSAVQMAQMRYVVEEPITQAPPQLDPVVPN
jgi:hypothetical protein